MPTLLLPTANDTLGLGRKLAGHARTGDIIALSGPLGAGKTVLARGFVQQCLGNNIDVASPTFTLVHIYDETTPAVWHFDLYRLESPDECAELGLDEALATGIGIIEWAEKGGAWVPQDRLDITLSLDGTTDRRTATLTPGPSWNGRLDEMLADAG